MQPFSLLIKPTGPDCNIACKYCFYTCKTSIFGSDKHRMSLNIAKKMITDFLSLDFQVSNFAWQGGEPTLMGLDFYKQIVQLQQQSSKTDAVINNALQTNGIALNDQWCSFLSEYKWLVGISLDGPKKYHDHYRLDKSGKGTFDKVLAAIENCKKHKVQFNILVLLNAKNVIAPDELFDFFTSMNIRFLQFIPCVEKDPQTSGIADYSVTPQQYGRFLCRIFDRWLEYGPEKISIRTFDSLMNYVLHGRQTNCTFGQKCGDYLVVEHNGDVFCCDFFVDNEHRLGSLLDTPLDKLFFSDTKRKFARQKSKLPNKCLICRHNAVCRGGCPKDRLSDVNYFCDAYRVIFDHCLPRLQQTAFKLANKAKNH
ncbi:MAG: anaerobic sulfatase maturase [Sedimentisphaerales bacterium]|nr:anaerobic sulfatase maturase [Sedimentisphaerales bacterium]